MIRYGSVAAALLLGAACDLSSPLEYAARVDDDLAASTAVFEARIFTDATCDDLELEPKHLDPALTATATFRFSSATRDGFAPVDLSVFAGELGLDLRARAADGTLLARRCTPVASTTEGAVVYLARFAPPMSMLEVYDDRALVAGEAQRPARVRVLDAMQQPVERVFASLGADRPLLATDALGFIDIGTSSAALTAGEARVLTVFGLPGQRVSLTAESLTPSVCPESTWSREIVPGLAGAQIALATADAGPRTLLAMLRPRTATSSINAIEMLAADEDATSLRSLTTATTAAAGHVAIAADRATGAATVAVIAGDTIELRAFDGARNRLGPARRAALGLTAGGKIDGLRALHTDGGDRFAAFGDVPTGAVLVGADGAVSPLLPGGDRRVVDLIVDADGAHVTTEDGLERFAWVDGALQADGALPTLTGQLVRAAGGAARAAVLDGQTLTTLGSEAALDVYDVGAPAAAVAPGDANGDGTDDLLLVTSSGARVVLLSPGGRALHSSSCAITGGPGVVAPLPLDRGGKARWAVVLDQTGRLALWVRP